MPSMYVKGKGGVMRRVCVCMMCCHLCDEEIEHRNVMRGDCVMCVCVWLFVKRKRERFYLLSDVH